MLILDFETRSHCDLPAEGTYKYVSHPSTEIICLCILEQETGNTYTWLPGYQISLDAMNWVNRAELVCAHNAEFDQGIWEYIAVDLGWPEIPVEKWYCSSSQCRVNALPASLDDAAWALGISQRKHAQGKDLIRKLSVPQADGRFREDPELVAQMADYCKQDVVVTDAIVTGSRMMSGQEHQDWQINCQINERGVRIDRLLATLALQYADEEQGEIGEIMSEITDGLITKHTQNQRIKKWLTTQLPADHPLWNYTRIYKGGVEKVSLDKDIRRTILLADRDGFLDIPDDVGEMLELLDDGSKSSVAKFKRMLQRADPDDDRVRGAYVFAGASQTLRYASRGLQMHNMRRDCWSAAETNKLKERMHCHQPIEPVMETLSKLIRPAIIPAPGKVFVVGDWSSIEARCLHYATDTQKGDEKLNLFEAGVDTYEKAADDMGYPGERQLGKTAELACGYQGGHRAFQAMSKNFGFTIGEDQATDIVSKWRKTNWWIVDFWDKLNQAAKNAIAHPGQVFTAGIASYIFVPDFIEGTLMCKMPGNNVIQYPKAKLEQVKSPWGDIIWSVTALKASYKPKADAKEWPRVALYGGIFCENICQAFSAAILRYVLRTGLDDCIGHTHDEIILEVNEADAEAAQTMLKLRMETGPEWSMGLPLSAEPVILHRYGGH